MLNTQPAKALTALEQQLMESIWSLGSATAESIRERLARPLKDSTVRTMLRRLEEKGFVSHEVEGRTYIYRATGPRQQVAAKAVRQIIERLCGGSVEQMLVGLVDNEVVDSRQLQKLAAKIAERKEKG